MVKLLIVLSFALGVGACAHDPAPKPQHHTERKWWQGDMDNEDRSFFIDSFFNGR